MKVRSIYIVLFLSVSIGLFAQEAINIPERTPEQEAITQTERLQRELNLNAEQAKEVYDINLHYARQRQLSNSRAEATQRIRQKNDDLRRVLNDDQYDKLQNKHYSRPNYSSSQPSSVSGNVHRSTKEAKELRNSERVSTGNYHAESPATQQGGGFNRGSGSVYNRGYNDESHSVRPAERSSSQSYQQRNYNSQPVSPSYRSASPSGATRSSGEYAAPSRSSSSGVRSSDSYSSPAQESRSSSSSATRSSGSSSSSSSSSSERRR